MAERTEQEETGKQARAVAFLGIGSSVGERWDHLRQAVARLQALNGVHVLAASPIYESPHLGLQSGDETRYPPHLNGVVKIETTLPPEALLTEIQAIEAAGQRQRVERWGPRTIDIDILLYDALTQHTDRLTLPHPGLAERAFVILPLADLEPEWILPDGRKLAGLRQAEAIRSQRIEQVAVSDWFDPEGR